ncbi:SusC/RagA family TonB-linked outer membrane protein [Pedobacter sp. L105]|uniref:SusC/RagA family TonB-linked outer membrane protein n=1 Tax=Pedobacter sp. L105 TaxID=1641871 RepID=UPI00131EB765|nr:SusC/RagA family TonB-linked outer membrane protein [Pedobacter sp. L105]
MRKNYLKKYFLLLACIFWAGAAFSQTGGISGKVTEDNGAGLSGGTVRITGTERVASTEAGGNFRISGIKPGIYTVTAQYIGYTTLKKQVNIIAGKVINLDFTLQKDDQALNEVVVIGYGSTKRKDVTGAVSTVTSKDFQQGQITTPEQLIAGKVAGVSVISNGGAPGAGSTIRIRGGASINGSNDPLIVLDGIPLSNNGISGAANPLSLINPNDIESFSILKDASAAAIYGNRASNGVILITTKKGQAGAPKIEFSTQLSISQNIKTIDVLSPDEFRTYVNANDASPTGIYRSQLGTANTDWQKEIYQTAVSTDNSISISGSTKNLPYRVSAGYTDQSGILKTSSLERYTGDINLSPSLLKNHLKINFNLKGSQVKQRFANTGAIGNAVSFNPTYPVYSGNDKYGGFFEQTDPATTTGLKSSASFNPVGLLEENDNRSSVYRAIGSLAVDYKVHFLPDLHVNLNLGYDGSKGTGSQTIPGTAASNLDSYKDSQGILYSGYYNPYKQTNENKLFEGFLSYTKDIPGLKSHIEALAGYSIQDFKSTTFNNPSYFADNVLNPNSIPNFPLSTNEYLLTSFYGRLNYVYDNKYILTGTLRNDYSTKFAPAQRSGLFPSGAFAWRINEEDFLKDSKLLSLLKLRLEYGVTGNQDGIGSYDYLSAYSLSNSTARYQIGNVFLNTYRPGAYYPGRTWETTASSNIAVDYGFFGNRLTGSVDYYYKKTKNLLALISQPALTNFGNQITGNIGNMTNRGLEINISGQIITQTDINWTANFNVTFNNNKITNLTAIANSTSSGLLTGSISGGTGNTVQINSVGYPVNSFYTYQQVYGPDGKPVDGLFVDRNKDGVINQNDLYVNKSPAAKQYFGFSSDFAYKKWSIGFVTRASLGNYLYNNVESNTGTQNHILNAVQIANNGSSSVLKSGLTGTSDKDLLSDYWIQNASFLKMDNAHIGYNFGKVFKKTGDLRISGNVQNVFTITKYTGIDPEVNSGIDNNAYPRPRTYVLGLNLNL